MNQVNLFRYNQSLQLPSQRNQLAIMELVINCFFLISYFRIENVNCLLPFSASEGSLRSGLDLQMLNPVYYNSKQCLLIPSISLEDLQENKFNGRSPQPLYRKSAISPIFYSGPESIQNIWGTQTTELEQFQLGNKSASNPDLVNLKRSMPSIWSLRPDSTKSSSPSSTSEGEKSVSS